MNSRVPMLHLLVVPLIALLTCNGVTLSVLGGLSWYRLDLLRYIGVMVVSLYLAYIWLFHAPDRKFHWSLWLSTIVALCWLYAPVPFFIWGIGMVIIFSVTRGLLLRRSDGNLWSDFSYAIVGSVIGFLFTPISIFFAVMIFVSTQVICEMRVPFGESVVNKDKFYESLKTAKRIIESN